MRRTYDAVIIGAGVIGAAIAYELAMRGYKTLNIDKYPAAGYGPTSSSCAIVRAHYSTWDGVAMAFENFSYWEDWEGYIGVDDERGFAQYERCGTILLKSPDGHWRKVLNHYRSIGVAFEEWDAATLKQRAPHYSPQMFWPPSRPDDERFWEPQSREVEGAIFTPGSGYVNDPQLATHNLQLAAEASGGEFLFREEVIAIRQNRERVEGITLKSGAKIDAPIVVNVAGPWSFLVNRMAGVEQSMRIKTRALRHEVHHVPAPAGLDFRLTGHHVSDGDQAIYFRPEAGNAILIGSEDARCDPQIWVDNPDDYDREITQSQWEAQVYRLARRLPGLRIPHEKRGLVDLYDVSDDWIPIYDRSDLEGYFMAIGTSGNQFKNAAGVGFLMAELIDACQEGHDHDREPVRVRCRYTGLVLNAGFYSRNRELNPDSSFTVNG